ncbi:MAG: hybrid sensor histidine kinase/response regulator [Bacteroidales bacterium]|nr:hybrid sensor histidine kinase/response regulator [Bacteroidales bacterium]
MKTSDIKDSKPLILIVDDEQRNLQILGTILMELNYNVIGANGGKNTMKVLKQTIPDLILLDIMMPDMDGYEACMHIKNNEKLKEIPVIFLTAKVEPEDIIKGFDAGGVDYITKPFNHAELLARISTHLELKKSRDALKKAEHELQISNASKDKFFTIIAHDLKSPFNAILNFSELLLTNFEKFNVEKQKELIGFIHQSGMNTYKLLENLLLWSSSQRGIIDFSPKLKKLYTISKETVEFLNHTAVAKTITLKNEISDSIYVMADKEMLVTILRNLLSNAIKFTPKGGIITINANKITNENNQNYIEISVNDNGIGIPKEKQSQLFQIGESMSTKGTENEGGTGLGLILCKEFVEKHGGKIKVDSEENKGSTFTFTIPDN